jgi:glycosyltransferase involved in cell wall biosynthesis
MLASPYCIGRLGAAILRPPAWKPASTPSWPRACRAFLVGRDRADATQIQTSIWGTFKNEGLGLRIAIVSTMRGLPWGGSEELWSQAAQVLLDRGHEVDFNFARWSRPAEPLRRLVEAGARPYWRTRPWVGRTIRRMTQKLHVDRYRYAGWLRQARPDFVLISVGRQTDDLLVADACQAMNVRYGILLQAASPYQWVESSSYAQLRQAYRQADRLFFVSEQNREILEANLALDLSHGEVVDNSFNVRADATPAWPASEKLWKLACVGRLDFQSKGQDLLLRLLARPRWQARPLKITFWGPDNDSLQQVRDLIELRGLHRQVAWGGFAHDIEHLWSEHHGLVLPSRFEGNALAMIEAMLCGRVPIVTNVGRAVELVDDNRTGFVAAAATVDLIDEALERAWQRRHDWQAMGRLAAATIRQRHSLRPAEDFADRLLATAQRQTRLRIAA